MFGFGPWELVVILLIVVLVFGVGKLPDVGSGMGKAIKNFKKAVAEAEREEIEEIKDKPETEKSEKIEEK